MDLQTVQTVIEGGILVVTSYIAVKVSNISDGNSTDKPKPSAKKNNNDTSDD